MSYHWAFYPLSPFLPSSFCHPLPTFCPLPAPPFRPSSPSLQDVTVLHHRFIDECFHRLDEVVDPTGGAGKTGSTGRNTSMLVTNAPRLCFKQRTPPSHCPLLHLKLPPLFSSLPLFLPVSLSSTPSLPPLLNLPPSRKLQVQMIERLLLLAQRYVMVVEVSAPSLSLSPSPPSPSPPSPSPHPHISLSSSLLIVHILIPSPHCHTFTPSQENHHFPRYLPPHGSCFLGHPVVLSISPDQPKTDFKLDVRN